MAKIPDMLGDYTELLLSAAVRRCDRLEDAEDLVGDTLLLDASSTVRRMIKYLSGRKGLTLMTNNDRIFGELAGLDARVFCTGGEYVRENHAFAGPVAEAAVRGFWADKVFFSSQGLSEAGEVSDHSEAENALRRVMLERAGQKI